MAATINTSVERDLRLAHCFTSQSLFNRAATMP